MEELIICVAPYPSEKQSEKPDHEIDVVDEAARCCAAGASIVHLHVRDENGNQTADTRLFQEQCSQIHSRSNMIIEGSTGGMPEHTLKQRCVSYTVPGVELGSLNLGSINMYGGVFQNPVKDILFYARELRRANLKAYLDCFDLSHLHMLEKLKQDDLIENPYSIAFIFDYPDTLPYREKYLDLYLDAIPPDSIWFLTRYHAQGAAGYKRALELGGHVRVGFEDGPFLSDGRRASSNGELVAEVAELAEKMGRRVVGPERARELMHLPRGRKQEA
jgi:3-keto-5-aminohexanoate cleavage enzyme